MLLKLAALNDEFHVKWLFDTNNDDDMINDYHSLCVVQQLPTSVTTSCIRTEGVEFKT